MIRWIAATLLSAASLQAQASITLSEGWVREAPPGVAVMAGYGVLANTNNQPETICEARSPDFGAVEFHRILQVDGQSRMRAEDALAVPAQGTLRLAPGDLHFMFFRPQRALKSGDTVTLELACGDQLKTRANLTVKAPP